MANYKKLAQLDQADQLDQLHSNLSTLDFSPIKSKASSQVSQSTSSIDRIVTELRNRRCGRSQVHSEWWCVRLSLDEFKTLQANENLAEFKYDYFPQFAQFVLRMAGDLHEFVNGLLKRIIILELFAIEKSGNQLAADFARCIVPTESPEVIGVNGAHHFPDGSFAHRNATELGVVIEISYSQKRVSLSSIAEDYLAGSDGMTQLVIGIDLEYQEKKGKEARAMTWRLKPTTKPDGTVVLKTTLTEEGIFRATDGSLANGRQTLRISLKDFGNKLECPGIDETPGEISITFAQLYDMVQEGEAFAKNKRQKQQQKTSDDVGLQEVAPIEWTRRPSPERLGAADEEVYRAAEKEVDQRLSDQDSDYVP